MATLIEPLGRQHERDGFECGKPFLNDFLTRLATQYERRNLARTYVLVHSGESKVIGYYTLASSAVDFYTLPATQTKKLPRHPLPAILLARLAVDQSVCGQGLGGQLLRDCFVRCLQLADQIGIHAVTVDAIDEQAAKFYEHFGFARFLNQTDKLFIPLDTIRQAVGI